MDQVVYYFGSKRLATLVGGILPRVFFGPIEGTPWKLEVRKEDKAWALVLVNGIGDVTPHVMHGWCRGYLYATAKKR